MRKINKIILLVSSVIAAIVMFYMGQQRAMVNAFVSSNVEALVQSDNDESRVPPGVAYGLYERDNINSENNKLPNSFWRYATTSDGYPVYYGEDRNKPMCDIPGQTTYVHLLDENDNPMVCWSYPR